MTLLFFHFDCIPFESFRNRANQESKNISRKTWTGLHVLLVVLIINYYYKNMKNAMSLQVIMFKWCIHFGVTVMPYTRREYACASYLQQICCELYFCQIGYYHCQLLLLFGWCLLASADSSSPSFRILNLVGVSVMQTHSTANVLRR